MTIFWRKARLIASAALLPGRRVSNSSLGDAERLLKQTGIRVRRYAAPDEATSDIGGRALEAALVAAGRRVRREELQALVVATTSPDYPSPATAHYVHAGLDLSPATLAFDVASSCSSFLCAFLAALPFCAHGFAAVLAAEVKHKSLGDDPRMRALFADGAAAVIAGPSNAEAFALAYARVDAGLAHHIQIPVGGSRAPATVANLGQARLRMIEPRLVYRHTVHAFCDAIEACWRARACYLRGLGLDPEAVPGVVYAHQANANILADVRERLGADVGDRIPVLMEDVGNMVCASLPVSRTRLEWLSRSGYGPVDARLGDESEVLALVDECGDALFLDLSPGARERAEGALRAGGALSAGPVELGAGARVSRAGPRVDVWVAAGGGFQTIGLLHARGFDPRAGAPDGAFDVPFDMRAAPDAGDGDR